WQHLGRHPPRLPAIRERRDHLLRPALCLPPSRLAGAAARPRRVPGAALVSRGHHAPAHARHAHGEPHAHGLRPRVRAGALRGWMADPDRARGLVARADRRPEGAPRRPSRRRRRHRRRGAVRQSRRLRRCEERPVPDRARGEGRLARACSGAEGRRSRWHHSAVWGGWPMKLHYNRASPFVRKVMAVVIETGLEDRIEPVTRLMTPIQPDADLVRDNPLGKVPCLVTDDGTALYDSRVVCEYLDSLHDGPKMLPAAGPARWTALRRQAEGDGIRDAGVLARYETFLRPQERRWPEWIDAQKLKFRRALDSLEDEAGTFGGTVDIGT